MEQMTITAKIQIVVDETDKVLLDETMSVYRNACNYVSDYVFRTHDLKQPIVLFQIKRLKTCKNRKESLFF